MGKRDEKRKYIRLNTIFSIEFQVVSKEDRRPLSELYEGFTRNVGKGGMGIFTKVLKGKDKEAFNFKPRETKLKLIINIPLDKDPIESFATVEWIEKQAGPIVDTYIFGVSYDFINELEYDRIISYVKWLRLKPKLTLAILILLATALALSSTLLFMANKKKIENEKRLLRSLSESKRSKIARQHAEMEASEMETELESAENRRMAIEAAFGRLAEKKKSLEKISKLNEEDLKLQIEELAKEKTLLEERIDTEMTDSGGESVIEAASSAVVENAEEALKERLIAEEHNYNKFRELILNEKIQSLSGYVSTHRSSIYHAASLFALAELRYKGGERSLTAVNYNEVIELYPKSKYALYSSHRLEQLEKNYNYGFYTLKDFYDTYNLPELFDYRNIEPYMK